MYNKLLIEKEANKELECFNGTTKERELLNRIATGDIWRTQNRWGKVIINKLDELSDKACTTEYELGNVELKFLNKQKAKHMIHPQPWTKGAKRIDTYIKILEGYSTKELVEDFGINKRVVAIRRKELNNMGLRLPNTLDEHAHNNDVDLLGLGLSEETFVHDTTLNCYISCNTMTDDKAYENVVSHIKFMCNIKYQDGTRVLNNIFKTNRIPEQVEDYKINQILSVLKLGDFTEIVDFFDTKKSKEYIYSEHHPYNLGHEKGLSIIATVLLACDKLLLTANRNNKTKTRRM